MDRRSFIGTLTGGRLAASLAGEGAAGSWSTSGRSSGHSGFDEYPGNWSAPRRRHLCEGGHLVRAAKDATNTILVVAIDFETDPSAGRFCIAPVCRAVLHCGRQAAAW